jgi:phosphoribosylformylglycinamidine synthase
VLGILEDAERALGMGFQQDGDAIVLLDASKNSPSAEQTRRELSSSEYAKVIYGIESGDPPRIDLVDEKSLVNCLVALANEGLAASAHDISDGGLAVTLAESGFVSEGLAAQVDLPALAPFEAELFGERGARAVVSARPDFVSRIAEIAAQYAVRAQQIGKVAQGEFRIQLSGQMAIRGSSESLRQVWKEAIQQALQPE